jgi:hypothetical protein
MLQEAATVADIAESARDDASGTRFKPRMPASLLRRHQQLLADLVAMGRKGAVQRSRSVAAQLGAFQSDFDNYAYVAERHLFAYLALHTAEDRAATAAVNAAHALFAASVAHVAAFTSRYADADGFDERSFSNELNFLRSWLIASLRRIEAVMLGYYRPESVLAATLRSARPTTVAPATRSV